MYNVGVILTALVVNSVSGSIQLEEYVKDPILSTTTKELLSSFKHCIVFIFDWNYNDNYEHPLTSTNYFVFYSETLSCSLVVETYTQYRQKRLWNPRFLDYKPHPLFTKYTATLINLYSSAATSTDRRRSPVTKKIWKRISMYNIPFNYVLIFMSTERFYSVDNVAMLSLCTKVSAPAVYILVLDEQEVYVVGFAQVLHSAPYRFKVNTLEESHIQHLHELVHKDLQKLKLSMYDRDQDLLYPHCEFGAPVTAHPNDCALIALMQSYNLTHCITPPATCLVEAINFIHTTQFRNFYALSNRSFIISIEFINYLVDIQEFSFVCIVQPGSMGFMAFVQAFDQSTWIAAGVAFLCLTLTVAAMSNKKSVSWWSKLQPSAVLVLMLFFERFYASSLLSHAASRQSILVLTLWAFAAMLLGMSYSGNMISELAAPSLPPMPRDMHELSLVEQPIFTSKFLINFDGEPREGYLHSKIRSYLNHNPNETGTLPYDLRRLNTTMIFRGLYSIIPELNRGSRKSANVLFAFADGVLEVRTVALWSAMTNSGLVTSRSSNLPFFDRPQQCFVQTNFLLPIFRKFLAKVFESGAVRFWEKGYEAWILETRISSLLYDYNMPILRQIWLRRVNLATIWRSSDALTESTSSPTAIDLDNLSPAFQLLVTGHFISTFALLNERWPLQAALFGLLHMAHKLLTATCRIVKFFIAFVRRADKSLAESLGIQYA